MRWQRTTKDNHGRSLKVVAGGCEPGCIEIWAEDPARRDSQGCTAPIEVHIDAATARSMRAALARAITEAEADVAYQATGTGDPTMATSTPVPPEEQP